MPSIRKAVLADPHTDNLAGPTSLLPSFDFPHIRTQVALFEVCDLAKRLVNGVVVDEIET